MARHGLVRRGAAVPLPTSVSLPWFCMLGWQGRTLSSALAMSFAADGEGPAAADGLFPAVGTLWGLFKGFAERSVIAIR